MGVDPDNIINSLKLVETINLQKKVLEEENDDLKSRLSEIMNDRSVSFHANENIMSAVSHQQPPANMSNVPPLNFASQGAGQNYYWQSWMKWNEMLS